MLLKFDMHVPDWLPHVLEGGAGLDFGVSEERPFLGKGRSEEMVELSSQ